MPDTPPLDALRARAREAACASHAPYSGRAEGAALLLADGAWLPGARVENASFPLTIPAVWAALAAVRVAGRAGDVRALALAQPLVPGEAAALAEALADVLAPQGLALTAAAPDALAVAGALPHPGAALPLTLDAPVPASDADGVALAGRVAARAHIPESRFPVGCVVLTADGRLVPGANVEYADWTRGLCAERTALATALAVGAGRPQRIWLACPVSPAGSPCGACRQVLAELAAGTPIVMARGAAPPDLTTPEALLPGAFRSEHLRA